MRTPSTFSTLLLNQYKKTSRKSPLKFLRETVNWSCSDDRQILSVVTRNCCKSLRRISSPAIPFNRQYEKVTLSRTTHPRGDEISIANLGDSFSYVFHLSRYTEASVGRRRRLYDHSFVRYRSLFFSSSFSDGSSSPISCQSPSRV